MKNECDFIQSLMCLWALRSTVVIWTLQCCLPLKGQQYLLYSWLKPRIMKDAMLLNLYMSWNHWNVWIKIIIYLATTTSHISWRGRGGNILLASQMSARNMSSSPHYASQLNTKLAPLVGHLLILVSIHAITFSCISGGGGMLHNSR